MPCFPMPSTTTRSQSHQPVCPGSISHNVHENTHRPTSLLCRNRVFLEEAFEVLEPDDGKLSRPVLRGPGPSNGVRLLDPHVLRCFLRPSLTEAPSLRQHYPASSVLRASPPPHTARPGSRELPVDPDRDLRWGFPCCLWSPMLTCRRHYPGRFNGACSLVCLHCQRPSP
jgi:hypothetical protein